MGAAEVISFEEVRARKQWDTLPWQYVWQGTCWQDWRAMPHVLPALAAPCQGATPPRSTRYKAFAHRNPMPSYRYAYTFLKRLGARTRSAVSSHPPPRRMALSPDAGPCGFRAGLFR